VPDCGDVVDAIGVGAGSENEDGELTMEAAAGLYTRIIFPTALSKTEPHLSAVQKAMLDTTPDCIKVLSVDGTLITMNRAGCIALNVPEDSAFGMPWLPLLPEGVHDLGQDALQKAVAGKNALFPGQSHSPNGTRYWDNLLTPVLDASGKVLSILCVSRDVTAKALLEKELEDAIERERLLSREMQHRIKNLFSVVSALISISEREADKDISSASPTAILREKVGALSRASAAVFSQQQLYGPGTSQMDLGSLTQSVLQPYGDRCRTSGDSISIDRANMTTFALFLHEHATNAVKYGALSVEGGSVSVSWTAADKGVNVTWVETGGPTIAAIPESHGFGTEMVDRIIHSAGGKTNRKWAKEGLIAELYLPNPS